MPLAVVAACFRRELAGLLLNPIEFPDQGQPDVRLTRRLFLALCLDRLIELAPGVRHATRVHQTIHRNHCVVAVIAIGLQIACEAGVNEQI